MTDNTTLKMGEFGDDAAKWAKAFIETSKRNGWKIEDINEGLMLGWFSNAIEVSQITRSQPEWQDISTAPKDGTVVMACDPSWNDFPQAMLFKGSEWICWLDGGLGKFNPTHWMPFPIPPEEK